MLLTHKRKSTDLNLLHLPIGKQAPRIVTTVIEIPQGSVNKYEFDKDLCVFRLDRNLHSPVHYPADYGFIPQTLAEDGDPLDILVLGDVASFPGCVYDARVIGLFRMLDQGVHDEKVLACATGNPRLQNVFDLRDIQPHVFREIEHFFSVYKDLEGKRTKALGWESADQAAILIATCHRRFREETGGFYGIAENVPAGKSS